MRYTESSTWRWVVTASAILCLATASAATGQAQQGVQPAPGAQDLRQSVFLGLGYVANAPNMFIGGNILVRPRSGLPGLYLDLKTTYDPINRRPGFMPDITVETAEGEFRDLLFQTGEAWTSLNAAVVWPVAEELALYAGAGLTRESAFREYQDPSEAEDSRRFYWIEDPAASGDYVNLLGGIFVQAGRRLLFQVGAELRPAGATVGATYLLPIGR